MKNIRVVLVPINAPSDNRKFLESIEGQTFTTSTLPVFPEGTTLSSLTDFMDDFNNDELDSRKMYFGYIEVLEDSPDRESLRCPLCGEDHYRDELSANEVDRLNASQGCISRSCTGRGYDDDDY